MELLERLDALLMSIAAKEGVDHLEEDVGVGPIDADGADDILRDHAIYPAHDAPVELGTSGVREKLLGVDESVHMVCKPVGVDQGIE